MNINAVFDVSFDEYLESQKLYRKNKQPFQRFLPWFAVVVGVAIGSRSELNDIVHGTIPSAFDLAASVTILVLGAILVTYGLRIGFNKRYNIESISLTNVRAHIDEDGIQIYIPGQGSGVMEWGAVSAWLEGHFVFVLISGFTFRPIPKSALAAEEVVEFREFLSKRLPPTDPK